VSCQVPIFIREFFYQSPIPYRRLYPFSSTKEGTCTVGEWWYNKCMDTFLRLLKQEGLPKPTPEYKFCPDRRWRFDYAFIKQKVAVEQEGGVWSFGRHTRGSGFLKDCEKYNAATLLGWRVLRYPPDLMLTQAVEDLRKIIKK